MDGSGGEHRNRTVNMTQVKFAENRETQQSQGDLTDSPRA
jgi:hypothetical protein